MREIETVVFGRNIIVSFKCKYGLSVASRFLQVHTLLVILVAKE